MILPDAAPGMIGPDWLPLLTELGDLKRIHSAGAPGSIAERLFARGWSALAEGMAPVVVMRRTVAAALAAARLGDLDLARLGMLGLSPDRAAAILAQALDEVAGPVDDGLLTSLRPALAEGMPDAGREPHFVVRLACQPRAGVTCPGRPRLLLQPAENHAEHCLMVAVYGTILAPVFGADPVPVFLAGMAHHLHNADMPDAGYSGEVLLGDALDGVIERARDTALAELDAPVGTVIRAALAPIGSDATADARAFHAADVLDRVLETAQHLRVREATMHGVLHDYALVHAGPVKPFHDGVLRGIGLL